MEFSISINTNKYIYIYIHDDPEIWRRNYRDANRTHALSMVCKAFETLLRDYF